MNAGVKRHADVCVALDAQQASLWKIQTIKLLAVNFPDHGKCMDGAKAFRKRFQPLIIEDADEEELARLFKSFSEMALKLWKLNYPFEVRGLKDLIKDGATALRYDPRKPCMVIDQAVNKGIAKDAELPLVHALTRPLIVSPRRGADDSLQDVIWSPAHVWV